MQDEERESEAAWDSRWVPEFYDLWNADTLRISVGHASAVAISANKFGADVLLRDMTPERARELARVCTEWADARDALDAAASPTQGVS